MDHFVRNFYRLLMVLSGISMVAAFVIVILGVISREVPFIAINGLDAYAGYAIAAALFFALPTTLVNGDHIRVTLVINRLSPRGRGIFEIGCLFAATALALFVAWYACRAVWISYITHDVSPAADASPLWIPQISMAIGCLGFVLSFVHALLLRLRGGALIAEGGEAARTE
ncbi:TRAP transporter small permease [Simplicispira hankyongi]|uniref:TRAP transporter small permease protein n=1 Tax=Simplicispira hankyongi TaxID=2315688 RepID=A0A398C8M6_9BURK|nr:TRAP transporter small permease [Simplicispira hankyongi]RID99475.1 TRAP transporter small permease [Simplicispira hankyongi]